MMPPIVSATRNSVRILTPQDVEATVHIRELWRAQDSIISEHNVTGTYSCFGWSLDEQSVTELLKAIYRMRGGAE